MQDSPDLGDRGDAVCVVGAGASGLTAIKNLRELGFAVDCYERETSVGGAWNWRHDRSPVYAGTHLISSRPLTEFPDFPMPDSWPDYPHHSQVLEYLERYAKHFGLGEHIWYGMEVASIEPAGDGHWDVTIRSTGGGSSRVQRYAAVVIANGHNWSPVTPEIPGDFLGQVIHASAYKDPSRLRNKRVLVIGGGNTGCDIAVEAAQHADRVWHSTRRGYWYAPKYIGSRPADQEHHRKAPSWLRQWRYRRSTADLTRWGVAAPDHAPFESHPVVNGLLPHYLGHGRIEAVPDVTRYDGKAVEFTDGRRAEPQLVITATGYRPRFDFAAPELLDADADGRPDLHLHTFARRHPTLAVVGLVQPDSGVFPLAHWQSVAVARWLRLRATDPERAAAVQLEESKRPLGSWSRRKVVPSRRHWFEVDHIDYLRAIESLLSRMGETRMSEIIRYEDWSDPIPAADREVVSVLPEDDTGRPPLLFVPGLGHGAWAFAEHWLAHAAGRGFPAHAVTPRAGGDLRAQAHDVVQVAAALPRQTVLIGHGTGGRVVARALGRYPARAAVLVAPVLDGWAALGSALRSNPAGTVPALLGGRLRFSARQLFGAGFPGEEAAAHLERIGARSRAELFGRATLPDPVGAPPMLVVGSPDDRVVGRAALDRAAARYGGAPLLFPGMGHYLMLETSWAEPIDAILDWLDKELPAAP